MPDESTSAGVVMAEGDQPAMGASMVLMLSVDKAHKEIIYQLLEKRQVFAVSELFYKLLDEEAERAGLRF